VLLLADLARKTADSFKQDVANTVPHSAESQRKDDGEPVRHMKNILSHLADLITRKELACLCSPNELRLLEQQMVITTVVIRR
jgi:hypothetical protein